MLKELSRQQIPIPTTVDRQLYEEFSSAAATERVSVSQLLADLMRDFIDNQAHEPNAETIAAIEEAHNGQGTFATDADDMFRQCGIS